MCDLPNVPKPLLDYAVGAYKAKDLDTVVMDFQIIAPKGYYIQLHTLSGVSMRYTYGTKFFDCRDAFGTLKKLFTNVPDTDSTPRFTVNYEYNTTITPP